MPNFGKIIKGINKRTLNDFDEEQKKKLDEEKRKEKKSKGRPKYLAKKECTCDRTHPCPLDNKCNRSNIIYQATLESENQEYDGKFYIGSATDFKDRWNNHNYTFRNLNSNQECSLKDLVWEMKDKDLLFTIKWKVLRQSKAYQPGDDFCLLCMDEKLSIMEKVNDVNLINRDINTNEKCLHKSKFAITNWKKKKKKLDGSAASILETLQP